MTTRMPTAPRRLTAPEQRSVALGIARGVAFLHENNIVHRDLAARNILVSPPLIPRISDFGMSRVLTDGLNANKTYDTLGPIKWMAPEQMQLADGHKRGYSTATDVFSFSVVLAEIVNNTLPWSECTNIAAAIAVVQGKRTPMLATGDELVLQCAAKCNCQAPHERISMADAVALLENRKT